ncbi:type VII secretion integral membrane protein EccD [Streptomyces sp. QTS52]
MTTAPPLPPARTEPARRGRSAVPGSEGAALCRITVVGRDRRADLAVPVTATVTALLPVLLRHLAASPDQEGAHWVLQRLGEAPLDPEGTPETLGLRHGDVLHLRPADDPVPEPDFDDVPDGVAQTLASRPGRWLPEHTRRLLLGLACLVLVVFAAAVTSAGPGTAGALGCAAAALLLAVGAVVAGRGAAPDRATAVAAGLGSLVFATLTGPALSAVPRATGSLGLLSPDRDGVLAAAAAAAVMSGLLLVAAGLPVALFGTLLALALAAEAGAVLSAVLGWNAAEAVATLAVAAFALGPVAQRVALRLARLRVPHLPRNADELGQDIDPEPGGRLAHRVRSADDILTVFTTATAALSAVACVLLVRQSGWLSWMLPCVLGAGLLLRARSMNGVRQRTALAVGGALGPCLALLTAASDGEPPARAASAVVLLSASGLLAVAARRMPERRMLPVWGHGADVLETLTALALVPLVLQLLGAYAYFRSLAG